MVHNAWSISVEFWNISTFTEDPMLETVEDDDGA